MDGKKRFFGFIKAEAVAYIITIIIFAACALVLTYTSVSEECIKIISVICTAISAFTAGLILSCGAQKGGIIWGALGGLIYIIILLAIFFISGRRVENTWGLTVCAVISVVCGALGGILGINYKK